MAFVDTTPKHPDDMKAGIGHPKVFTDGSGLLQRTFSVYEFGDHVVLSSSSGFLSFYASLDHKEARELAEWLIVCANHAESFRE